MKKLIILFCFFGYFISHGQTAEEWEQMKQEINTPENLVYRNYLNWRSEEFQRLKELNNWPKTKINTAGDTLLLSDFDENKKPIYQYPAKPLSNSQIVLAAKADELHNGGSLGVNIEGQGMLMGIWESGSYRSKYVLDSHQDYQNPSNPNLTRIILAPNVGLESGTAQYSKHATQVASFAVSSDSYKNGESEGIAPKANLISFSNDSLYDNALDLFSDPTYGHCLSSNFSYGSSALKNLETIYSKSYGLDHFTRLNPYHTVVISNGNLWLNIASIGSQNSLSVSTIHPTIDSNGLSYDFATCKITRFRILPQISAKTSGWHATYHPSSPSNYRYFRNFHSVFGTSLASPEVAAGVLLLQQLYRDYNPRYMRANSARALLMHSATDIGAPGPDLEFGFGQMNLEKAGRIIQNDGITSLILERSLDNTSTIEYEKNIIANNNGDPLEVMLVWDDVIATLSSYISSNIYDFLVNDLDLRVYDAQGIVQNLPYTMNGVDTNLIEPSAILGDNDKDTYEKIIIDNPIPGETYTIKVTCKNPIRYRDYTQSEKYPPICTGSTQNFSLVITGIEACTSNISISTPTTNSVTYHAGIQLTCSSDISGSTLDDVYLYSGENVLLKNGFHANNLNTHIDIVPCDPNNVQAMVANRYQPVERQVRYFPIQSNPDDSLISNSQNSLDIDIYPNPTSADLTFELSEASSGRYEVRDALGRLIYVDEFEEARKVDIPLREKNLDGGTYFLLVSTPTHNFVRKFVVQ